MSNSGVTCTDFSLFNKTRKGVLGKSGVVLLAFLFELRWRLYDLVIVECVPQLDMGFIRRVVGEHYWIDAIKWGPENAGWACARPRLFVVMTAKAGKICVRRRLSDFASLMSRHQPRESDAKSMWWCAGEDDIRQALYEERCRGERAAKHGFPQRNVTEKDWEEALHASKATRLQLYRVAYLEKQGYNYGALWRLPAEELKRLVRFEQLRDPGSGFIADLDQAPGFMQVRSRLPTLVSHFTMWSLKAGRPLLGKEALVSQGLPLVSGFASWTVASERYLSSLPEVVKQDLAGNTINLQVLMGLLGWVGRVSAPRSHVQLQHELKSEDEQATKRRKKRSDRISYLMHESLAARPVQSHHWVCVVN